MFGQMMDQPLLISSILTHAANYHSDSEIVTRTVEGPIHRYTYKDAEKRSKKMAFALKNLGVQQGDRIGMIRFGSRVDIYFKNKQVLAKLGQNVVAGESLIASE